MKKIALYIEKAPYSKSMKDLLNNRDYIVDIFESGRDVINFLNRGLIIYDLAIVDRTLEDISSLEVARALIKKNPHIPIIFKGTSISELVEILDDHFIS